MPVVQPSTKAKIPSCNLRPFGTTAKGEDSTLLENMLIMVSLALKTAVLSLTGSSMQPERGKLTLS